MTPITSAWVLRATRLGGLAYFSTIMVLKGRIRFRNWEMTQRLKCPVCCNYRWPYTGALSWDITAFAVIYWLQHLNAESLSSILRSKKCQWCGNVPLASTFNCCWMNQPCDGKVTRVGPDVRCQDLSCRPLLWKLRLGFWKDSVEMISAAIGGSPKRRSSIKAFFVSETF